MTDEQLPDRSFDPPPPEAAPPVEAAPPQPEPPAADVELIGTVQKGETEPPDEGRRFFIKK